jgi:hypothetical protein
LPARIGMLRALNADKPRWFTEKQRAPLGQAQAEERPMTVFAYVNTSKQVGDPEHIKVFAMADAAETWFEENDREGVAFEYEVIGPKPAAAWIRAKEQYSRRQFYPWTKTTRSRTDDPLCSLWSLLCSFRSCRTSLGRGRMWSRVQHHI